MNFCDEHWQMLRRAIDARGLSHLVADDGETAARRMSNELEQQKQTLANFDPLMSSMFAISSNAMQTIAEAGGQPLYLLAPNEPEDPVEGFGPQGNGRTWPRCPLCYLNLAHELTCKERRCDLDHLRGYDFYIERAADEAKSKADELLAKADR